MSFITSRITVFFSRNCISRGFTVINQSEKVALTNRLSNSKNVNISSLNQCFTKSYCTEVMLERNKEKMVMKKKIVHVKPAIEEISMKDGHFLTMAYATAYSYNLQGLKQALVEQNLYEPGTLKSNELGDVVVASAKYSVGDEPREMIFFREGAVVFWNCSEMEAQNVLNLVKKYEIESYPQEVIYKEKEIMTYSYHNNAKNCHLQDSTFVLVPERDNSMERYTFSHAMAQSARLGAWESRLALLASAVSEHTARMQSLGAAHVDKKEVVRKLGELFSLRHRLNVESDLLDTPDMYWEEERLEMLYSSTVAYFTIPRRIRVLNERLSHCVELLELLSSWAADRHHVRLEWMVIALILAEVCFELLHFFERSWDRDAYLHRRGRPSFSTEHEELVFQELSVLDT